MKKNTLLKIIGILALVLVVLSWIIPGSYFTGSTVIKSGLVRIGIFDLLSYPLLAFQFFIQTFMYIVIVGALYGVLEKTGKYRNVLEKIAKSLKGKELIFIISVALLFTVMSSLLGLNLMLFLFIPAIISIILLMGYDKITAFLTTFVSIFIGMIGSTYSFSINGYINSVTATDWNTEIISKLGLLVIGFAVYILFTLSYAKKAKKKNENIEEEIPFIGEKKQVKVASWPIYLIFGLLFVLIILAVTPWANVFELDFFTKIHEAVTTWTIGEHTIVAYLLGDIAEFGSWSYTEISVLIGLAAFILGFIYKLKFKDILGAMGNGLIKTLKPALLISFAMVIVIMTAYHPFYITITEWLMGLSDKFNIFLASIDTIIGSVLNIEMIYLAQSSIPYIASTFPAESAINTLVIITQAFYGLTALVAPTSTLLILGLTYLNIPYTEWLKKSWKLIAELFVVIVAIIVITVLI